MFFLHNKFNTKSCHNTKSSVIVKCAYHFLLSFKRFRCNRYEKVIGNNYNWKWFLQKASKKRPWIHICSLISPALESAPDLLVFIGLTYYYLNLRGTTFLIKHLRDLCKPLKRLLQEMAEAMNLEELRTHLKKLYLEGQKVPPLLPALPLASAGLQTRWWKRP